ncbi:hypothetical protein IKW73_01805 [Candidatus Saccharibacteria bacterium]|nr:hypothetical protein [Candidatus Saccharibacteria bacterium]
MNGTVTENNKEENVVTTTLSCQAENVAYPFFEKNDGTSKTLKITASFSNDELSSIYLKYFMAYDSADAIERSEATNHFHVSRMFENDGLAPAAYTSTYNQLDDGLQFSIYASGSEIDEYALKYFMLGGMINLSKYSMENVEKVYADGGISCAKE